MKPCCFCGEPLKRDPGFGVCEKCLKSIRKEMAFEGEEQIEEESVPATCECGATFDEANDPKKCDCCKFEGCGVCLPKGECEECSVEYAIERARSDYRSDMSFAKWSLEKHREAVRRKHEEELQNAFK